MRTVCLHTLLFAIILAIMSKDIVASPNPSLSSYTTDKCEEHLKPIFDNITISGDFESQQFCTQLQKGVDNSCTAAIVEICQKAPKKWIKYLCEEYLPALIC